MSQNQPKNTLIIRFYKISHQFYCLKCWCETNLVLDKKLETKSFLRHDLMHFCVESQANLTNSFFAGLIKKTDEAGDETQILQTEKVVAILQGLDKDSNYQPQIYLDRIRQFLISSEEKLPDYLNLEFIKKVEKLYLDLLRQYENLKTGDSFVEVFFEV